MLKSANISSESPVYKWLVLANVMLGTFMAVLDATIVNVGLPKIMASFGVGITKIQWIITAYLLALAVMLPASAWLADKFGSKKVYIIGLALFTGGSALCGLAVNEDMLIAARIIQGIGGGVLQPLGMAIITRVFPPSQRGIAIGFWAVAAAASISFGPIIGGWLVDKFSWHLIFEVNVPIGIIGLIASVTIMKEYKNPEVKSFDKLGFLSAIIFLPLLLVALSEGNSQSNAEGWHAPYILASIAISIIFLVLFITVELRIDNPLLNLRLLRDRNFGLTTFVMFIFGMGMFGSTFLVPLYLQNSLDYTALQAGAVFVPVGLIQGFMSPIAGRLSSQINPKIMLVGSFSLLAVSFWLNSKFSIYTEHWYIMLSLYIRGFAMGVFFSALSTVSLLNIRNEDMAQASGVSNTVRQIAGSLGVSVLTALLYSRDVYHTHIYSVAGSDTSPAYQQTLENLTRFAENNAGSSPSIASQQAAALLDSHITSQAYVQAIGDDFFIAAVVTALCLVPLFFLKTKKQPL